MLSVVVPYRNMKEYLVPCLESVRAGTQVDYELILVHDGCDNHPECGVIDAAQYKHVKQLGLTSRVGFTRGVNMACHMIGPKTDYICLLNCDTVVPKGWANRLIECLEANPEAAAVIPLTAGCKTVPHPGHFINAVGRETSVETADNMDYIDNEARHEHQTDKFLETLMIPFFCAMIRADAWRTVGELDDGLADMETTWGLGEDDDWCYRAATLGWKVGVCPAVYVWHRGQIMFDNTHRDAVTQGQMDYLAAKHGMEVFSHG